MESLKRSRFAAGLDDLGKHERRSESDDSCGTDDNSSPGSRLETSQTKSGKKTRGRVKIDMEFIDNKLRRYTTFSKRKSGIMKKAHELATLTGTQVMLLVASETGHVYTFATRKLQPILSSEAGKQLIQTCLNSPDSSDVVPPSRHDDQRMSAQGFEEPELSYVPSEDTKDGLLQKTYHMINAMSAQHDSSPSPQHRHGTPASQQTTSAESITLATMNSVTGPTKSTSPQYSPSAFTLLPPQAVSPHQDQQQYQFASAAAVRMQMVPVMQDRSSCSSMSPPNVHESLYSSVGRTSDDNRISFLNPYTSLQRPVAGVQQLLVASPRSLQLSDAQVVSLEQDNDSKETSR